EEKKFDWLENMSIYQDGSALIFSYFLSSYNPGKQVKLKYTLKITDPRVAVIASSVRGIWPHAEFFERENSELFGIDFGVPEPYKILPNDFSGFPLRKDYEYPD